MKKVIVLLFLAVLIYSGNISAQTPEGNLVVITKFELAFPQDSKQGELDSLAQLYEKAIMSKNEYVLNYMTLRHNWGHDNSDFVSIFTVKSFEDVEKANTRMEELFKETWKTEEERDAFDKAYNKYFTGRHSDEIYRQVGTGSQSISSRE